MEQEQQLISEANVSENDTKLQESMTTPEPVVMSSEPEEQPQQHVITTITSTRNEVPETPESDHSGAPSSNGGRHHSGSGRDSTWLELEVCREFLRGYCSRSAEECRFAHPTGSVIVKDGKVTCCFDNLKDRCTRDSCKYLHPPTNIKESLIQAGKKYGQAMSVTPKPTIISPAPLSPTIPINGAYYMDTSPGANSRSFAYPDVPMFSFPPTGLQFPSSRIQVCENFDNNITCPQGPHCFFAHPDPYVRRDHSSNTVTCCWNYLRGFCRHSQCWFYHPPPHIVYYLLSGMAQQFYPAESFVLPAAYTSDKAQYSSPTNSLGQYSYPLVTQYSPTATPTSSLPIHPAATAGISTLPQAIVQ